MCFVSLLGELEKKPLKIYLKVAIQVKVLHLKVYLSMYRRISTFFLQCFIVEAVNFPNTKSTLTKIIHSYGIKHRKGREEIPSTIFILTFSVAENPFPPTLWSIRPYFPACLTFLDTLDTKGSNHSKNVLKCGQMKLQQLYRTVWRDQRCWIQENHPLNLASRRQTRERPQHQQHQRCMASDPKHHRLSYDGS